MMLRNVERLVRAGIAIQVAALEFEGKDVADAAAADAIKVALKEAEKALKALIKDDL